MRYYTLKLVGEDSTHIEERVSEAFLINHYDVKRGQLNQAALNGNQYLHIKEVYPDELFIRYEGFTRED